jgi:hypothetical protein
MTLTLQDVKSHIEEDCGAIYDPPCNTTDTGQTKSSVDGIKHKKEEHCMRMLYVYDLLTLGLGLPLNKKIRFGSVLKNFKVDWRVGCALRMLEKGSIES